MKVIAEIAALVKLALLLVILGIAIGVLIMSS